MRGVRLALVVLAACGSPQQGSSSTTATTTTPTTSTPTSKPSLVHAASCNEVQIYATRAYGVAPDSAKLLADASARNDDASWKYAADQVLAGLAQMRESLANLRDLQPPQAIAPPLHELVGSYQLWIDKVQRTEAALRAKDTAHALLTIEDANGVAHAQIDGELDKIKLGCSQ